MKTETIKTIDELLTLITALQRKHNQLLWFRGVANEDWDLVPSIQRSPDRIAVEKFIANDFYKKKWMGE